MAPRIGVEPMTDNPMSSAHQKCRGTVIKRSGQEGDCGIAWSDTVTPPRNAPRGGIEPSLPGPREPTIYGRLKVPTDKERTGN